MSSASGTIRPAAEVGTRLGEVSVVATGPASNQTGASVGIQPPRWHKGQTFTILGSGLASGQAGVWVKEQGVAELIRLHCPRTVAWNGEVGFVEDVGQEHPYNQHLTHRYFIDVSLTHRALSDMAPTTYICCFPGGESDGPTNGLRATG